MKTQTELVRDELDRLNVKWKAYPYNPKMVTKVGNWCITECMHGRHLQAYITDLEPEEVADIIFKSGLYDLRPYDYYERRKRDGVRGQAEGRDRRVGDDTEGAGVGVRRDGSDDFAVHERQEEAGD